MESFRRWVSLALILGASCGCESTPLDEPEGDSGGSGGSAPVYTGACSAALRQTLGLVESVSSAGVEVLESNGQELVVYVDASAGGFGAGDSNPWVYLSLASGARVEVSDIDALASAGWDLAFKRYVLRTNSGDSGPGQGGALRIALPWESVDLASLGDRELPRETWFDDDCNLLADDTGAPVTTLSGWSEYDLATHLLAPAPVTFVVSGGTGTLYKLSILDYYATASGGHGDVAGRYLVRVAPLE